MLPLMNPNNLQINSTNFETLPGGEVAHTWWQAGKHPRTLADGSWSWLVVCVLCFCFYFNGCDLKWEKFYFYEVYLCITDVERYCILLRSKLYLSNEEIKLPFPSLTLNELIMSCCCEVMLFTVGIFKADTKVVCSFLCTREGSCESINAVGKN